VVIVPVGGARAGWTAEAHAAGVACHAYAVGVLLRLRSAAAVACILLERLGTLQARRESVDLSASVAPLVLVPASSATRWWQQKCVRRVVLHRVGLCVALLCCELGGDLRSACRVNIDSPLLLHACVRWLAVLGDLALSPALRTRQIARLLLALHPELLLFIAILLLMMRGKPN